MKKQIVYILSTNYAGSHYLSLMLGANTHSQSVGELHRLNIKKRTKKNCYICASDEECPMFKGISNIQIKDIYNIIFQNLEEYAPECTTIIDNSKKTKWAKIHTEAPYEKKYIHLIRDPRALIRRWALNYSDIKEKKKVRNMTARRCFKHAFEILSGNEYNVYIHKWLYQNQLISNFLTKNNFQHKTVTYYDLATNTSESLAGIMDWIGEKFEPEQIEYWKFTHHGSQKEEYQNISGKEKYFDTRWKEFLTEKEQEQISNNKYILKYLDKLGVSLAEDGLKIV